MPYASRLPKGAGKMTIKAIISIIPCNHAQPGRFSRNPVEAAGFQSCWKGGRISVVTVQWTVTLCLAGSMMVAMVDGPCPHWAHLLRRARRFTANTEKMGNIIL